MIHRTLVAACFVATLVLAQDTDAQALYTALGLPEIIEIMREEGVVYGAQIGTDLFPN